MGPKVSNIIAIELAILIGIMSWMVYFLYSRLASVERTVAEIRESTADRVAALAPSLEARNQRPYTIVYRADRERARPVEEESAETLQDYDQDDQEVVAASPSYAEPAQEPAIVQPDYAASPQNVAYQQPVQAVAYEQPAEIVDYEQPAEIVVYQQPAGIVVFSNPRRFANRCRSTPRLCAVPDGYASIPRQNGTSSERACGRASPKPGVVPHRNPNAPSCRPTQGFRPGRNR